MFKSFIAIAFFALTLSAGAADIFNQRSAMGGGSSTQQQQLQTQVNTGQDTCAVLANERRSIEYIDQNQIWVPIEQQNANYHRMIALKAQMGARGCSY